MLSRVLVDPLRKPRGVLRKHWIFMAMAGVVPVLKSSSPVARNGLGVEVMKKVSFVRVVGKKMFAMAVCGTLVAAAAAQGIASAQTRETAVRTLGGPNRFSGPMHSV